MMTEEQRIERIERYLGQNMTKVEIDAFEQEMKSDEKLRSDVQKHRVANEVIRYANQKDLKERLIAADRDLNPVSPRRMFLSRIAIAASILVMLTAGAYVLIWGDRAGNQRLVMSTEELAVEFFSPATQNQMRGTSGNSNTFSMRLVQADALFAVGDYAEAAKSYESLASESNPQSQKADWNMTLSRMASGDSRYEADLKRIATDSTHLFHKKAIELVDLLETK